MLRMIKRIVFIILFLFTAIGSVDAGAADNYFEDFDSRQDDTTIDGIDYWVVNEGETLKVITQDSTTYTGSGKALELTGAETAVNVLRGAVYGNLSPCWVEFIVKPGIGAQAREIPTGKIAAVTFDYSGKIYTSDGSSWVDTGKGFSETEWYRVILKLNFATHLYAVYIELVSAPMIEFIPVKENLAFIDPTINSLNQIGFGGVYSTTRIDETYIDDLIIHFVDRLQIISASQTLVEDQPSNPITVQLQNIYSEPQVSWRDITLELKSSSEKGKFSLDKDNWNSVSQVIIEENAQSASFYYKDSKTGQPIITVKEYPDRGWSEALQQQKIVAKATYFDVAVTTPHAAGEYFNIKITARDDEGEVDELYNGEINIFANYIAPAAGRMQITPTVSSGFEKGKLELSAMYPDCGIIEIMVKDINDSLNTGKSGQILFIPVSFNISAESQQIVSKPFSLSISGLNAQGQVTPNYQRQAGLKVVLVSPQGLSSGELKPTALTSGDFSEGLAEVDVSYNRWGAIKIEVCDSVYPARNGLSGAIKFRPSELLAEVESSSSDREFFYIGEKMKISISALDSLKVPIPNYLEKIKIYSTLGLGLPGEYQFTAGDAGKYIFVTSVNSAGFYSVYFEDKTADLQSEKLGIKVKEATLEVISTVAPVGTTEVTIRLVDEEGNVIICEDTLEITLELEEEYADSSAHSSAVLNAVKFNKGVAKVLVSNTQSEIVTIRPRSIYDFKVKKGTVVFGRIAKTGIGTLMWREVKD